jgi:biopolymer transport protein TolR
MAMGIGSKGGRGGRRGRGRRAALSEINVTPMVDVMLVLLIIFMISAPLLNSGIKIQLPKTEAPALKDVDDPITISIKRDGEMFIQDKAATYDALLPRLTAMTGGDLEKPIFVRSDGGAPFEVAAKVMGALSKGGFTKINIVTEGLDKGSVAAKATDAAPSLKPAAEVAP